MKTFDSRLATIVGLFAAAAIADDLRERIDAELQARQADEYEPSTPRPTAATEAEC